MFNYTARIATIHGEFRYYLVTEQKWEQNWNQDLREEYFPNVAFEALGLAFIRNLALLARQEQQGLLWRNT